MKLDGINPAYIYAFVADVIALGIGFGLLHFTSAQTDLVMQAVAAFILLVTGVSVPVASAVREREAEAYQQGLMTPVPGTRGENATTLTGSHIND